MRYSIELVNNPTFRAILGLTNTTLNSNNLETDKMASEAQVLAAWNAMSELEQQANICCKDMVVWETYVQIVRLNTTGINGNGHTAAGIVVSPFRANRRSGIARKGEIYEVVFPVKFDAQVYSSWTALATQTGAVPNFNQKQIFYKYVLDNEIQVPVAATGTRRGFLCYTSDNTYGTFINPSGNWGSFVQNIAADGTVAITDSSRRTDFTVIRYYTQWTLRECADGSMLSDPT